MTPRTRSRYVRLSVVFVEVNALGLEHGFDVHLDAFVGPVCG